MQLRDYQQSAVSAMLSHFETQTTDALCVIPTGGGKSLVMADICARIILASSKSKILVVAHTQELVDQNFKEFRHWCPEVSCGIYCAALGKTDTWQSVIFCSIQSVAKRSDVFGHVNLVIVDECHRISRASEKSYGKFVSALRLINPSMRMCGMTATPYRLDSGRLDSGVDAHFDSVAFNVTVAELVALGYLAPLAPYRGKNEISLKGVKTIAGEYNSQDLEYSAMLPGVVGAVVDQIVDAGNDLDAKGWLVYGCSQKHCDALVAAFVERDISTTALYGPVLTNRNERAARIEGFKNGQYRCLVSLKALTTGFNVPHVDLLAIVMSTKSTGLFMQILGRAMRISSGKTKAHVLDFGSNFQRLGTVDSPMLAAKKCGVGDNMHPVKFCPKCDYFNHAAVRVCENCGHQFPEPSRYINVVAANIDPMLTTAEWRSVHQVQYKKHINAKGNTSIQISYAIAGFAVVREWIRPKDGVDKTLAAMNALSGLTIPEEVLILREGNYLNIKGKRGSQLVENKQYVGDQPKHGYA